MLPGIALNGIQFSESYIATGSDDGYLRLWPLDLSTVFLEAKHEGPVADVDITPGMIFPTLQSLGSHYSFQMV